MIIKNKFTGIEIKFYHEEWAVIKDGKNELSLGVYPNARWDLIERALKFVKDKKGDNK